MLFEGTYQGRVLQGKNGRDTILIADKIRAKIKIIERLSINWRAIEKRAVSLRGVVALLVVIAVGIDAIRLIFFIRGIFYGGFSVHYI